MYNVKLKTGLSPSADDHSISEPQKKRGTYAFELLKNTERVYRNLYYLYSVRASLRCGLLACVLWNAEMNECLFFN